MPTAPNTDCITLDHDCLYTIFDILTSRIPNRYNKAESRPLDVIRAASQVCRQWRELLLASPSIWGRVIDLDVKNHGPRRREWMEEVVRRAGSAHLWITGDVMDPATDLFALSFDTQAFFIQLLGSWERIEKLSVVILPSSIPEPILDSFASRAPILKLFDVALDGLVDKLLFLPFSRILSSRQLFSEYAPSLVAIDTDRLVFRPDAPWLSDIRDIVIPFWMTKKAIFDVLRNAPSLQRFSLDRDFYPLDNANIPFYTAKEGPTLSCIDVLGIQLAPTVAILNYASPGELRSFRIKVNNRYFDDEDMDAVTLSKQAFAVYVSRYFSLNPSTEVSLAIHPRYFAFRDIITRERSVTNVMGRFNITIQYPCSKANICGDPLTTSLLDMFVDASTLTHSEDQRPFKSVTQIELSFTPLYNRQTSLTLYPHLYSMLSVFDHVQSILINELSSHILWNTVKIQSGKTWPKNQDGDHAVLFPRLHTVYLDTIPASYKGRFSRGSHRGQKGAGFKRFFLWRKRIGFPVARFDLTRCAGSHYAEDLRPLEKVGGLEVVWKRARQESGSEEICRYVCGSGERERLKGIF